MNNYEIIEDNAGTITMFVRNEEGSLIFGSAVQPEDIQACIADVENAAAWDEDTNTLEYIQAEKDLENIKEARKALYENITSYQYGWKLIADNNGIYTQHMGYAGKQAFGLDAD